MYADLVCDLQRKLTDGEWNLVAYYIEKADSLSKGGNDSGARESLLDAVAIALSHDESE